MKFTLTFLVGLFCLTSVAQLPPYQRNPITTNGPAGMTNQVITASKIGNTKSILDYGSWRVICVGDSLSTNYLASPGWFPLWQQYFATNPGIRFITNFSVPGRLAVTMAANYTNHVQGYAPSGGTNAIVFFQGGINDLATNSWDRVADIVTNYLGWLKRDGFTVCAFTISDSTNMPIAQRTNLAALNSALIGSSLADMWIDLQGIYGDVYGVGCLDGVHFDENANKVVAAEVNSSLCGHYQIPQRKTSVPSVLRATGRVQSDRGFISYYHEAFRGTTANYRSVGQFPTYVLGGDTGTCALWQLSGAELIGAVHPGNGNIVGGDIVFRITTNGTYASKLTATNGYFFPTNPISAWPAAPRLAGEAFFGNSNGVIYLLTSAPGSATWAATNKIAP